MARKRGGLAGLYDRNKGVFQAAAPVLAGAVGGPLAGAAVGAAMRGFDRPGKSGIGFDVEQGMQGGAMGYGAGALGQSARNALQGRLAGLFTGGAKELAAGGAPASAPAMTGAAASTGPAAVTTVNPSLVNQGRSFFDFEKAKKIVGTGGSRLGRVAAFAEKNPNLVSQAVQGLAGGGQSLEERQYEDEQELARTRASLVAQMLTGIPQRAAAGPFPQSMMEAPQSFETALYNTGATATPYAPSYERMPDGPFAQSRMPTMNDYLYNTGATARRRSAGMFGPGMR